MHKLKKTETNIHTAVATKIDNFIQPKPFYLGEGSSGDSFKLLAEECSEKTAPAIDSNLAEIVKSFLLEFSLDSGSAVALAVGAVNFALRLFKLFLFQTSN